MPDQTETLTGVALHVAEPPTWLRTASVRVADSDLPRIREAVAAARAAGRDTMPGEWADVLIVWGRPRRRPLPEAFVALAADVEALRALLLEVDR